MRSLKRIVSDYLDLVDEREMIQDTGKITTEIAKSKAKTEFEKYHVVQDR